MRRLVRRLRRWFGSRGGPVILMYHRIATPEVDPWGLAVSPERFAEHVQALRASRTMFPMESFVALLQSGEIPLDAVALTFDDGYIDNLIRAKPILESAGVPATVFLTTSLIGTGEQFWWDELARMVLLHATPISTHVAVAGRSVRIELPPIDLEREPRITWRAWNRPVTAREQAYQTIWQALWDRTPVSRQAAMEQLRGIFGTVCPNPDDLPMEVEDVRKLVSKRIAVGAHGCFHQPLTSLPSAARFEEMRRSRVEAERLSALPVIGLAYPHGACDAETADMARRVGFQWACSTNESAIDPKCVDLHKLPRIPMGDWRGEALLAKLNATSI